MAAGDLALVLHAHLPYVRSGETGSLEEDWYFQALQECYLPLLEVLEAAAADPRQRPRLTLGLSPTLLSLLCDTELNLRFPAWLEQRRSLLRLAPASHRDAALDLQRRLASAEEQFLACGGNLLPRFRQLRQQGGARSDHLRCHPRLPAPAAPHPGGGPGPAAHGRARAPAAARGTPPRHLAAGVRLLRGARPGDGERGAALLPARWPHACCMRCRGPATASTPRSAHRQGSPSLPATAPPPCRCGTRAPGIPAIRPTGNSTATWAGTSNPRCWRRPGSSAAVPSA